MRENLLKKQPTWGLRRAQGTGQKSATPATLTKVILVLLTMLLIPSAAWSVEVIKTITFNKQVGPVSGDAINNSTIPVSVSEKIENSATYTYNSIVSIIDENVIYNYSCSSIEGEGATFTLKDGDADNSIGFMIRIPGNYPGTPSSVKISFAYANAEDDNYNAYCAVIGVSNNEDNHFKVPSTSDGSHASLTPTSPIQFTAEGNVTEYGTLKTTRSDAQELNIMVYMYAKNDNSTTFTITEVEIKYDINESDVYGLTVAGIPVTNVNASAVLFDKEIWGEDHEEEKGTVSFKPAEGNTPATLTLSNANLEITTNGGAAIESSLSNLVVNLVGVNNITSSASTSYAFKGNGSNNTITFQTDDVQNPGKIQGIIPKANVFNNITPSYQGLDLAGDDQRFTIGVIEYGIKIGGVTITSAKVGSDGTITGIDGISGTVKFTPADPDNYSEGYTYWPTLTLDNATINGVIDWYDGYYPNLRILVNGTSKIINSTTNETAMPAIQYTYTSPDQSPIPVPTLHISKGSNDATLFIASYKKGTGTSVTMSNPIDDNFNNTVNLDEGMTSTEVYPDDRDNYEVKYTCYTAKPVYSNLKVANRVVHAISADYQGYKDNILKGEYDSGTGTYKQNTTVTFTLEDEVYILTLNNATINAGTEPGISTGTNLTIILKGANTINNSSGLAICGDGSDKTITFASSSTPAGSLTLSKEYSAGLTQNITIAENGWTVNILDGASSLAEAKEAIITKGSFTGLEIAGAPIATENLGENGIILGVSGISGGVSYDSESSTLTLNDATINGQIKKTSGNLTVYFVGENTITVDGGVYAIEGGGSGTLAFSTDDDNQGVLTFNGINSENYIARQWTTEPSITFTSTSGAESDWYITNEYQTKIYHVTKNNKYDLWLNGMRYCDANLEPASGTAFDPGTSTLTYQYNGEYHIYSGLSSLTVKTGGARLEAITFGAPSGETISNENEGSLKIVKYSDSDVEQAFTLVGDGTNPVISGFTTVDYDDFVVISEGAKYDTDQKQLVDAEGQVMTSAIFVSNLNIAKPTFESTSSEGVTWVSLQNSNSYPPEGSQGIPFGTIKYSIEYADGSEGVTDEMFTEAFTISKPATVTACVTLNGESSDPATGKYFGASKEEYTVAIGDKITGTSWFIPEIVTGEGGDNISCEFMLKENDNSGIFEREGTGSDSYLVAKKSGTTTVNASLWSGSITSESITVLNSDLIALKFTVGESLSSVFEGNNNYGGFYNDSDTPYAKPEGTSVYLITGISEDGTSVTTQSIDYLPAHTAVLLQKGTGAKAITKIPYEGSATVPTNNKFYYSNPNSPATAPTTRSWYVIYNNQFVKVTGGTQVKGGKCYLDLGTTAGTRGFYNIGDGEGTTAIHKVISEGVNSEKWTDGEWYTLQGQRVAKPAKGLYIRNGKKVVVK